MAKWAGARYRPLGAQTEPPMTAHDIVCVHTMVGYLKSTDTMFHAGGYSGTESHFGVGGKWGSDAAAGLDGVVYQWQDTSRQADANLDGAPRVISIETADNAPQSAADILEWTPKQVEGIAQTIAWCCRTYDIPATLVPDSKPSRRGIAYHRQGIDPWRVAGGEKWSGSRGKECPGDRRIAQLKNTVIPRVRAILNPPPPPEVNVADEHNANVALMNYVKALYDDADGQLTRDQLLQHAAGQSKAANDTAGTAVEQVAAMRTEVRALTDLVVQLTAKVDELLAPDVP